MVPIDESKAPCFVVDSSARVVLSAKPLFLVTKCPNLICQTSVIRATRASAEEKRKTRKTRIIRSIFNVLTWANVLLGHPLQAYTNIARLSPFAFCRLGKPIPRFVKIKAKLLQQPPELFALSWKYDQFALWWHVCLLKRHVKSCK